MEKIFFYSIDHCRNNCTTPFHLSKSLQMHTEKAVHSTCCLIVQLIECVKIEGHCGKMNKIFLVNKKIHRNIKNILR